MVTDEHALFHTAAQLFTWLLTPGPHGYLWLVLAATALAAAATGDLRTVKALLDRDPNARDSSGSTPLAAACEMNHPRAAAYLGQHGAK